MQKKSLAIVVGVLVLAAGGYVLAKQGIVPSFSLQPIQQPTTHDVDLGNGLVAKDVPKGVTVALSTSTPKTVALKAPSLTSAIVIGSSISADVAPLYKKKIEDARAALLSKNADVFNGWLMLGSLYQDVGDYENARQAFAYVSAISPSNIVSFNNLGILYHLYLRDFPKAEENFLAAIKNDPTYVLTYENLFDLYRLSYKTNTSAAADILKLGLKNNPGNKDLQNLLDEYQKAHAQ